MAALGCFLCFGTGPARAGTTIRLRADRIAFYSDRYIIEADGNVHVTTSDGAELSGDTFSMDLKLNRFLIASHVQLRSKGGNIDGAAIADFLDFHRVYFIPVIAKPDRWTYENGDYTMPLKGREMPGDVFYFPDLTGVSTTLTARSASIGDKSFARFDGVTSHALGLNIPLPSQYVYFGINRDLAQNSLAGANADLTYNAFGNNNSISAFHVRKDQQNGFYGSFEQHLVGPRGYAVFSVNPGTKRQKFWSLLTDARIGKRFQITTFTQLLTEQHFLEKPTASATWSRLNATQAFDQSFLQADATFTNYNLLGTNVASFQHPSAMHLTATTFNHRIGHSPFYENLSYGFGFNHDSYVGLDGYIGQNHGLQEYGGVDYTTIWDHTLSGTIYLPSLRVGNRENLYKSYSLNARYTKNYQWFSVPHYTVTDNTSLSLSRLFSRQFNAYVEYDVVNTGDYYHQGGYTPPTSAPIIGGVPVTSILAFRGVATQRTATIGTTYSANPNLVATLTYSHHQDFPIPYPGLFAEPSLNNLGEASLGRPPDLIIGELRALVLPHIVVDVNRGYFFNFGNDRWTPQFTIQVTGQ
jgi:hypothetical protein